MKRTIIKLLIFLALVFGLILGWFYALSVMMAPSGP